MMLLVLGGVVMKLFVVSACSVAFFFLTLLFRNAGLVKQ